MKRNDNLIKKIQKYPFAFVRAMEELYPQKEKEYTDVIPWETSFLEAEGNVYEHHNTLSINVESIEKRWLNRADELYITYNKKKAFYENSL